VWYANPVRIVVCDVGLGNLRSVERALLEVADAGRDQIEVTPDPDRVASADRLVMLGEAVRTHLEAQRPYLGICLGLQILFGSSQEAPGCAGLGVLEGTVGRLEGGVDDANGARLKIPHIGWNVAEPASNASAMQLLRGSEYFYFVHSFAVSPVDTSVIAGTTEYGGRFVSAVAYGNVFACQFHPEKSQRAGLALLRRFLAS